MAKPLSEKCLECSKKSFKKKKEMRKNAVSLHKPFCWQVNRCKKKRSYYRKLEYYREALRIRHRYLKFKGTCCRMCGALGKLVVHHIVPQSKFGLDSRFNTLTLCHSCHVFISRYYSIVGWGRIKKRLTKLKLNYNHSSL